MIQPQFTVTFDQGTLLLTGHGRDEVETIFGSNLWTWDRRVAAWRCEAFHYRRVILTLWNLREQRVRYEDQAKNWTDVKWAGTRHSPAAPRTKCGHRKLDGRQTGCRCDADRNRENRSCPSLARQDQMQHANRSASSRSDVSVASTNSVDARL